MRGVESSTYYMLSRSKARLCIRSAVWCTASVHVLDYEFPVNQATKTLLRHAIPTRLKKHHADEVEVEISWDTLVYYTQSLNQYYALGRKVIRTCSTRCPYSMPTIKQSRT